MAHRETRPDRAESLRCSCSEAPPCANNNPFLMSSVCGNTDPNTSVPMIASVPAARLQMIMGNSFAIPKTTPSSANTPILQCQFHSRCVTSVLYSEVRPLVRLPALGFYTGCLISLSPKTPNQPRIPPMIADPTLQKPMSCP